MPGTAMERQLLEQSLRLACRAPSFHNSQPWQWVVTPDGLDLHLDPRQLVASDASGRQAVLSCGAILDHFRVACAAAGWTAGATRYPNPNDHKHLASIAFSPMGFVTEGHRHRADAIRRRRTDRLPYGPPQDWDSFEPTLRRTVGDSVLIDVLGPQAHPDLQKAAALSEAARLYDSTYHADLFWWTSAHDAEVGIPHSSLNSAAEDERVAIGRRFPVTHHQPSGADLRTDESLVIVLSTYDGTPSAVLQCGEALSAALLSATMAGLATCTLTHVTEVPASLAVVQHLTGRELPQVLIRMGSTASSAQIPPPTPRRPLSEVLIAPT
ncbi:NAD(P)H nitroreductase [Mycolicibacterium neoaurum]|uniref:Acg family FMN-binding oxidoreductase n=1 Tax=Mycolicibacterium neoaurum TaxID=1795 RepID=UPI002671EDB1|nr:NAD(P)H nitroreductase [Mycolicibacterium neoaurum]MDO3401546.1 NAD(P)H nitroreductase [Mycolicibacterium neoaurum]